MGERQPRFLRYTAAAALFVVTSLGLGTLVPRPLVSSVPDTLAQNAGSADEIRTVLLLSSAIHTDLALPVDADVAEQFAFLAEDGLDPSQAGVSYIVAGWGGRSFYSETPTWSDLKPGPVFSALTVDRSVMHIGLAGNIDQAHSSVTRIELDEDAFEQLLESILASFSSGADGAPIVVSGANYGDFDRFYEAVGWFNAVVGCNIWTARMLRRTGLTTGWWTPLPALLSASLHLHNDL
ncbi:uncharacterized protein (TIGR02117 family) [Hoeflea halophila]|uniref:Uncharacterized protein (TIGR02117 family) n=1 Tax=Hoeflea halophila TaxID=714899 RepID=A0A286HKU7_9HYPH|nr:TIGR02117 family protein [Hoeflea halophila]SOE08347.1 uncharacterized protein (TIGR02117 family) [Hoeflea halophila]